MTCCTILQPYPPLWCIQCHYNLACKVQGTNIQLYNQSTLLPSTQYNTWVRRICVARGRNQLQTGPKNVQPTVYFSSPAGLEPTLRITRLTGRPLGKIAICTFCNYNYPPMIKTHFQAGIWSSTILIHRMLLFFQLIMVQDLLQRFNYHQLLRIAITSK